MVRALARTFAFGKRGCRKQSDGRSPQTASCLPAGSAARANADCIGEAATWPDGSDQCERAQDGQSYGFVIFDAQDRATLYLEFSTWHDADRAAREAQGLLVTAPACVRR